MAQILTQTEHKLRGNETCLGFSSNGSHVADLLGAKRIDHRALSHIGVANEAHADLLLVHMQLLGNVKERIERKVPEEVEKVACDI